MKQAVAFLLVLMFCTSAFAIPMLLPVQGKLRGKTVNDVNVAHSFTFSFYSVATGGSAVWTVVKDVDINVVDENMFVGVFTTKLGENGLLDFNGETDYNFLEIKIGENPAMAPRIELASTAYAFIAKTALNAELLDFNDSSYYTNVSNINDGTLGRDFYLDFDTNAQTACTNLSEVVGGTGLCLDLNTDKVLQSDINTHFVPYIGATKDVNLWTHNLGATDVNVTGRLIIGAAGDGNISASGGHLTIANTTQDGDLLFSINDTGTIRQPLWINGADGAVHFQNATDDDPAWIWIRAGATATQRAYFGWLTYDGTYKWAFGRNADNTIILFSVDGAAHRLWVVPEAGTEINSDGTSPVRVNASEAGLGTGGFQVWSGGASPAKWFDVSSVDTYSANPFGIQDETPDGAFEIAQSASEDLLLVSSSSGADGDLFIVNSDKNVGIGERNPVVRLDVSSGGTAPTTPSLTNTIAIGADAANATNKYLGQIGFIARDPHFTAAKLVAYISGEAAETYDADIDVASVMRFYTGAIDGTNPVERMSINNQGDVNIGASVQATAFYGSGAGLTGIPTDVNDHFVPYIAADKDVNLGEQKLLTAGDTNLGNTLFISQANNRVGIGTTAPAKALEVLVSSNVAALRLKRTGGTNTGIELASVTGGVAWSIENAGSNFAIAESYGGTPHLVIQGSTGDVGLGTTVPAQKLNVIGDTNITGYLTVGPDFNMEHGVSAGDVNIAGKLGVTGDANLANTMFISKGTNRVGVGTNVPLGRFNIKQSADSRLGGLILEQSTSPLKWSIFIDPIQELRFTYQTDDFVTFTNTGEVGIGTTRPTQKLNVIGDVNFVGDLNSTGDLNAEGLVKGSKFLSKDANAAFGTNAVALGIGATAFGNYSFAMGYYSIAGGGASTAIGFQTIASGTSSTAIGYNTKASGLHSTAMGSDTEATGDYSTATGRGSTASGYTGTAIGWNTVASHTATTATGWLSEATNRASTAMGLGSKASGVMSTAMGTYSIALGAGSVAIGSYAVASDANTVVLSLDVNVARDLNVMGDLNVVGNASIPATYMQASDVSDQSFAATGTPYSIELDTIDDNVGISRVEDGNIEIRSTGIYYIAAQPQVAAASGGAGVFHMWIQKDTGGGFADVSNSNVELSLASLDEDVILLIDVLKLNKGDKIRMRASVSDIKITLDTQSPAGEPVIPSIIFSMYKIGT